VSGVAPGRFKGKMTKERRERLETTWRSDSDSNVSGGLGGQQGELARAVPSSDSISTGDLHRGVHA
jgi:hypothetical protein